MGGRLKLRCSRGDADAAAAAVDDREERGKKHLSARNKAALLSPSRSTLTRRGRATRRLAHTSQREERERGRGGGRPGGGMQTASIRCCDISEGGREGAKWKHTHIHTHTELPLSTIPLSTTVQLHFFFSSPPTTTSAPLSSAPVSARLRLGDKYGSWSRTQRPGAHFSLTFVRSTTNKTPKGTVGRGGDKNLQAIFSRGRTRRRGRRSFLT